MHIADLRSAALGMPDHEVWRMIQAVTGRSKAQLATAGDITAAEHDAFLTMLARRRSGEPLQYLEGTVQFGPLELAIDARALVPRPETEQLWDMVVRRLPDTPSVIVDLCTGSGNLALALKHSFPSARVLATELFPETAALARENVARTGLAVEVLEGDLFQPLPEDLKGRVDVVISNPPYLAASELEALPVDVRDHEPHAALVAGVAGDEVLAAIAREGVHWLRPGGLVAIEISEFLGKRAAELMAPYSGVVLQDLAGRDRFVVGTRPEDVPADRVGPLD